MQHSNKVIQSIQDDIISGKIPVGDRLPSEEKFCANYGVSRTVIREALQNLRGRGLLRTLKGSGTYIAESSLDTLAGAMETYSVLSEDGDFLDLIDFRILLESECARLAASHAGESEIKSLQVAYEAMNDEKEDSIRFVTLDISFHQLIAKCSGNRIYTAVLRSMEKKCIDYAHKNRGANNWHEVVMDAHRKILDAIERGKPDEAAESMRLHLVSSRRHFVDLQKKG